MLLLPYYPCLSIELADVGGEGVQVMEDGIVGGAWHAFHIADILGMPWGEDEERALYACVEARLLGLPVAADGFLLQMDQWIAFLYAAVLYLLLAFGNARGDDDRCPIHDHTLPPSCLGAEGIGLLVRDSGDEVRGVLPLVVAGSCALLFREHSVACLPMAEHLHLLCPTKQEEVAEGGVVGTIDDDMQLPLHELGIEAAIDGAARVVMDIVYHGSLMALMLGGIYGKGEADGIVVIIIEEGALYEGTGGVVSAALVATPMLETANQAWFARGKTRVHRGARWGARRLYEARYFAAPAGGAGGFEALDDVAKTFIHALLDMDNTMPMVGHAHLAEGFYGAVFGGLYGSGLFPFLMDDIACWGKNDGWIIRTIRKAAKPWLAFRNDKRDVVNSRLIIVVTGIARPI